MIRLIVAGVSYCVSLILICHCLLTCPIFTLLPSVFFILKAHRDFSLNVICAIQAWFIIIIITHAHSSTSKLDPKWCNPWCQNVPLNGVEKCKIYP